MSDNVIETSCNRFVDVLVYFLYTFQTEAKSLNKTQCIRIWNDVFLFDKPKAPIAVNNIDRRQAVKVSSVFLYYEFSTFLQTVDCIHDTLNNVYSIHVYNILDQAQFLSSSTRCYADSYDFHLPIHTVSLHINIIMCTSRVTKSIYTAGNLYSL